MNILKEILEHKRTEVEKQKELYPVKLLEQSVYFETPVVSLCKYLRRDDRIGIIAEIKRQSPSEGPINPYIDVEQLSIGYMQAGASALSVLTDKKFFGGRQEDLSTARKYNFCPILRKDFIVDEYQVIEAKSIGADAILLIASALPVDRLKQLAKLAVELGMEVLLEVRTTEEVETYACDYVQAIGVNNRDLTNFNTNIETSLAVAQVIPEQFVKVSESGISKAETILKLKSVGYDGFLIGSHFMRSSHPQSACETLVKACQKLSASSQPV